MSAVEQLLDGDFRRKRIFGVDACDASHAKTIGADDARSPESSNIQASLPW